MIAKNSSVLKHFIRRKGILKYKLQLIRMVTAVIGTYFKLYYKEMFKERIQVGKCVEAVTGKIMLLTLLQQNGK